MRRTHVAVLRGGPSEEYEVSLQTGAGVLQALRETDFVTHDIIVTKQGEWLVDGRVRTPQDALLAIDVVFNAMHGAYGEDGQLQRILERLGIPYTGSASFPSSVAMNKALTKETLRGHGIKMAPHMRVTNQGVYDRNKTAHSISELFGPTYVIKPLKGGSSIGTQVAHTTGELAAALEQGFAHYDELIVEQYIQGKEATVGVIEGYRDQPLYTLPEVEIASPYQSEIFDTNAKYTSGTEKHCPGRFTREHKDEMASIAAKAHQALGLRHYSRTDMIVADDGVYFLEINTLPGLTPTSLVPKALGAVGGTYLELILHLLNQARR
jgi:D-alanine-D-alanine ligase